MIWQASQSIAKSVVPADGRQMSASVLWAAILSIIVKELLYRISRKVAIRNDCSLVYANAQHHRSDALSSIVVVLGFVSIKAGYAYGDQVAAIAVGLMIIHVGIKIVGGCLDELSERAVDSTTAEQIQEIIASEGRIRQWHKLRTRSAGREIFLDLHILVDPALSITHAHEIAESLETAMHARITRPVNITVHVEPDSPELRK